MTRGMRRDFIHTLQKGSRSAKNSILAAAKAIKVREPYGVLKTLDNYTFVRGAGGTIISMAMGRCARNLEIAIKVVVEDLAEVVVAEAGAAGEMKM